MCYVKIILMWTNNSVRYFLLLTFLGTIFHAECSPIPEDNRMLVNLTPDNFVTLRFEITDEQISKAIIRMYEINTPEVFVFISSYGGSVSAGEVFINAMDGIRARNQKISCIADLSMSMAFIILQHCDNRYALSNSILMQHQMSFSLQGASLNVKNYLKMIDEMDEKINEYQAKRINLSPELFKKKTEHDWWIYGYNNLKHNIVDKIVKVNCSSELFTQGEVNEMQTFFGKINLVYSRCPLGRAPISLDTSYISKENNVKQEFVDKLVEHILKEKLSKYNIHDMMLEN